MIRFLQCQQHVAPLSVVDPTRNTQSFLVSEEPPGRRRAVSECDRIERDGHGFRVFGPHGSRWIPDGSVSWVDGTWEDAPAREYPAGVLAQRSGTAATLKARAR